MRPRVLHLTPSYPPVVGGIEDHVANLVERLPQHGYEPLVLTPQREESNSQDSSVVYRENSIFFFQKSRLAPGIITKLFQLEYDLLHVHAPFHFGLEFATVASKIRSVPLIITVHMYDARDTFLYQLYQTIIYNRCLDESDRIIPTTRDYIEGYAVFERNKEKLHPVPLGVDITQFSPQQGARSALGFDEDENILLFVGAMEKHHFYKNINMLIEAFARAKTADRLLLVGSGDRVPDLKQKASQEGVADKVEFPGYVTDSELPVYYSAADLFVLPSKADRGEAFGIVLLEAMACGTPVLATDIPGVRSVVGDGGMVIPPEDLGALVRAIDEGIQRSKKEEFCPRQYVYKNYNQSEITTQIAEVYDSLYYSR